MRKKSVFLTLLLCSFFTICVGHVDKGYIKYGDIAQIAIPVMAGGISLVKKDYNGIKLLIIDTSIIMASLHGLKFLVNSKRPHGGNHSFPSAHTGAAFIGAGFLHRRYGINYGAPAYLAAALVGHSRIVAKAHWYKDLVGGAVIALAVTWLVVKPYKKLDLVLMPTVDQKGVAIHTKFQLA